MKPVCIALLLILPAIALAQSNQKQISNGRYDQQRPAASPGVGQYGNIAPHQQQQQRPGQGGVGQYGNINTLPIRATPRPVARDPSRPSFVPGDLSKPYRPNQQQPAGHHGNQHPQGGPSRPGNHQTKPLWPSQDQHRGRDDLPRQQQQQQTKYQG